MSAVPSTNVFFFCLIARASERHCCPLRRPSSGQSQRAYQVSTCPSGRHTFYSTFNSRLSSCVPLCCLRKKVPLATDRNSKHPHVVQPSLDPSPNILNVSVCLLFLLLSLPPSLPPSSSAPIGSRSYSAGCLRAPSHQNLAEAVHICPHTSRSHAFGLWTDGTEREPKYKVKGGKRSRKGKFAQRMTAVKCTTLWLTGHFVQ